MGQTLSGARFGRSSAIARAPPILRTVGLRLQRGNAAVATRDLPGKV
ncbi:hypothetical protein [Poseidonocella sp. HB161398]|nr:hypothetical protein [Poseidonocella sp. HB161398]